MVRKVTARYLYLDGVSSHDLRIVLLGSGGELVKKKIAKQGTRSERLLKALAPFFERERVTGLIVAQGGGSFTQTRLVCAVANALAYAHGIKLAAVQKELEPESVLKQLKPRAWQSMILPSYRAPGV